MIGEMRLALAPVLSGASEELTPIATQLTGNAAVQTWRLRLPELLYGRSLHVDGLTATMTDVLVRIEFADGVSWVTRLTPQAPRVAIPGKPGRGSVALTYFALGVEHILLGIDHLLEAVIALSIVFVAAEILRARRGEDGLATRAPWIVAFTFGLLHGFGFAGALAQIGLPATQIPLALLFFNVGVEAGQLLFVAAILAIIAMARRTRIELPRWAGLAPPYAIGSVAMFWDIQRVATF